MPSISHRVDTPNERHNLDAAYRKKLENVVPELVQYNEVLKKKSVDEIYNEYLQPAFESFNAKQKRRDRRLDVKYDCSTYLEYQRILDKKAQQSNNEIAKKGKPPIRELVLQFGNPEQGYGCMNQTNESREKIKAMLRDVDAALEKRYPQFVWGDSIIHADEHSVEFCEEENREKEYGSIHLHKDFVPLCYKNKQGTSVQVAFERCLEEMGFETFEAWKLDMDQLMESVLKMHGLEREYMDNHNEHQDSKQFHRQQKVVRQTKELERQREVAEKSLAEKTLKLDDIETQMQEKQKRLDEQTQKIRHNSERIKTQVEKGAANSNILKKQKEQFDKNKEKLEKQQIAMEENAGIMGQVEQAKIKLETTYELIDAANELLEEQAKKLGSGDLDDGIKKAAERSEQKRLMKLFERFIELPVIKPLWETFIENERAKTRSKGPSR